MERGGISANREILIPFIVSLVSLLYQISNNQFIELFKVINFNLFHYIWFSWDLFCAYVWFETLLNYWSCYLCSWTTPRISSHWYAYTSSNSMVIIDRYAYTSSNSLVIIDSFLDKFRLRELWCLDKVEIFKN